jgi:hypothetical protein
MTKYSSRKTVVDNINFSSKREANRYVELKLLQKAGLISNLSLQPEFMLQPGFEKNGKRYRPIRYIADFRYFDERGNDIVEDTKGVRTKVYRLKKKLFEYRYRNLTIRES